MPKQAVGAVLWGNCTLTNHGVLTTRKQKKGRKVEERDCIHSSEQPSPHKIMVYPEDIWNDELKAHCALHRTTVQCDSTTVDYYSSVLAQ
jgi:hypothetical protein